ncbi:sensor histidine kinase [Galbitalea sp. SE-J8]|uniref:sensor histidine kinase n=1 Tax=Galbitalea sp. SE-J8 TaxID=3054952 RepID=UPI00259C84FA|nr:sensor histidine kinase [Galbitalea sp. SE-J8]MDM4761865.1 sensor histidine kinase [Galbitalea sp. SE-J8]
MPTWRNPPGQTPPGHGAGARPWHTAPYPPAPWATSWEDAIAAQQERRATPGRRRLRLWLPVVISAVVQVPVAVVFATHPGLPVVAGTEHWRLLVGVLLAVIGPLALIAARRAPGPVVAVIAAAACASLFAVDTGYQPPYIALAFAIGAAVVRGARLWAWISVAAAWVTTIVIISVGQFDWPPPRIAATTIGILIVFGLAEGARSRREGHARLRERVAQRRQDEVQAERVRIARELHDVLAHSLSSINVQAGVGLHLIERQPEKAADALASIKETSKTALDEVRSVLGVLRAEDGADPSAPLLPEPGLDRLPALIARVEGQGLRVELADGIRDAPRAVQLAAYRIVQEALTNVVRHAGARTASVALTETDAAYRVRITDDGTLPPVESGDGGGRGLLGMRERAELLGGSFAAGPGPDGGFVVEAHIPKEQA